MTALMLVRSFHFISSQTRCLKTLGFSLLTFPFRSIFFNSGDEMTRVIWEFIKDKVIKIIFFLFLCKFSYQLV